MRAATFNAIFTFGVGLVLFVYVAVIVVGGVQRMDVWQHGPDATACAEDDPCWDCSTMGNKVCGVTP